MKEISLHILDIAENSVNAGASKISIEINENLNKDELLIIISDNGKGMDTQTIAQIHDPFVTSRTTRNVGLGIPFLKAAAESCNGFFKIESEPTRGTTLTAKFQESHIDRMPMGDIASTILNVMIGYAKINWIFKYQRNGLSFELDDKAIKDTLGDVPLSEPAVINYLRNLINDGIASVQ